MAAPPGHPWHELARATDDPSILLRGLAVALTAHDGVDEIADLLRRLGDEPPDRLLIGHHSHPAAVGVARSAFAELGVPTVVVDLLDDHPTPVSCDVERLVSDPVRWRELRVGSDGTLWTRTARLATLTPSTASGPLAAQDVVLVTGGPTGITALCARGLAASTGAIPVFVGRRSEADPAVSAAITELRAAVGARYLSGDITDPTDVARLVAEARTIGTVRGLLHGAAFNHPQPMRTVDGASLRATLAPKVDGFDLLAEALAEDLTLLVAFGSIIGRQGLDGQAEYCVANDWLRHAVQHRAARLGDRARTHVIEWSAWEGSGMAARLGVLTGLRRRGVVPIDPDHGVEAFLALIADRTAPTAVVMTSRFVPTPVLCLPGPAVPVGGRFVERRPVSIPGIEGVFDSEISLGDDPYLREHEIGGTPVLPAVLGIEALVQAARATLGHDLTRDDAAFAMTDLEFREPIVVEPTQPITVQTLALVEPDDTVRTVLRTGSVGRTAFAGRVVTPAPPGPARDPEQPLDPAQEDHPLYDSVLFHQGRFRRLIGYRHLTAFTVTAYVRADTTTRWFSPLHSQDLSTGDPGLLDAALHVLLPCVPHRTALPVAIDRIELWRRPGGIVRVDAVEIDTPGEDYVFDVELSDPGLGAAIGRISGLRLRATGATRDAAEMPAELTGPWMSRRVREEGIAARIELLDSDLVEGTETCAPTDDGQVAAVAAAGGSHAAQRVAAARAAGLTGPMSVGHTTADGFIELVGSDGRRVVTAPRAGGPASGTVCAVLLADAAAAAVTRSVDPVQEPAA